MVSQDRDETYLYQTLVSSTYTVYLAKNEKRIRTLKNVIILCLGLHFLLMETKSIFIKLLYLYLKAKPTLIRWTLDRTSFDQGIVQSQL